MARKHQVVADQIRELIVSGAYGSGMRLPTRLDLLKEFPYGLGTVQRALAELADEGFVEVRGRNGTYVSENPPHVSSVGMVTLLARSVSRYYTSLYDAMKLVGATSDTTFRLYAAEDRINIPEVLNNLCDDIKRRRIGGLIFATGDIEYFDMVRATGILETNPMPAVGLASIGVANMPVVETSNESFLTRSIGYLQSRGRRRIAHLCMDFNNRSLEDFENDLSRHGLNVQPYLVQPIPMSSMRRGAARVVNLMMQLDDEKRPDALIIHDDNLIDHAVSGLLSAGVRVPYDLDVVACVNWPTTIVPAMPIVRLGSDMREVLKKSLVVLDAQRRGETPPEYTAAPALFENELADSMAAEIPLQF